MTDIDLDAIEARHLEQCDCYPCDVPALVPALVAEVRRLRAHLLLTEAGATSAEAAIARVRALCESASEVYIDGVCCDYCWPPVVLRALDGDA